MFTNKLISTAVLMTLTILALGQGAVSAPQTSFCGAPGDPPCPGISTCCPDPINPTVLRCLTVCTL
ncbi:hypothetical protein FB451DRAFT_1556709 [Mycena latifolia]|nr:hypothetical protein FB451DRAFT_1556709 [Mycena latifolia]